MEDTQAFTDRLGRIQSRVRRACERAGRDPNQVRIVAVSKTRPAESVVCMGRCGQRAFAENKVQEAAVKIPRVHSLWPEESLEWRLVGHLQRNKIKQAVQLFQFIDSVDSLRLVDALQRECERIDRTLSVLLQFNCSREAQKNGFALDDLEDVARSMPCYDRIEVRGLMTIAHLSRDPQDTRQDFAALVRVKDALEHHWSAPLPELSMGMSQDFEVAVETGSTLIRIGTALFGARES